MGRKSKLTPELQAQICEHIANGNTYETASALVGINRSTFFVWMKKGENAKQGKYKDFFNAVKKADSEFLDTHIRNIKKHSANTWQASAWLLERRRPDIFAKNRIDISGGNGKMTIEVNFTDGGDDDETD